jgi:hypothetical protein
MRAIGVSLKSLKYRLSRKNRGKRKSIDTTYTLMKLPSPAIAPTIRGDSTRAPFERVRNVPRISPVCDSSVELFSKNTSRLKSMIGIAMM